MPSSEFRREYLVRLPLPLAQLYGRAFNAKSPRERHDNAFYLFEALVKLSASTATAYYLDEISNDASCRVPMLDRLLAQLALPSLGQWLGILRELTRHFASRVDTSTHPWGKSVWDGLSNTRKDLPGMLALHQRIKNGPDGELATDQTCSLLGVMEGLVQYRNSVFGHGAGRMESFYESEMGPLLFPAINEILADGRFSILGPASAKLVYITDLRLLESGRTQVDMRELVGLQSERIASLEISSEQAARLLPNRVGLLWPGRSYPLRLDPLLQYRESEFSEEVLFLNRDRNRKQVEYLSYTTGRTERDRTMMTSLAALLSQVTNHSVSEADLQKLSEQSLAETPSMEVLFQDQQPVGKTVGEYELISELGRGGMGVVYLARQTSLGRLVALKMLPTDLAGDELAIARFRREIRHLARCDDPHIVKVLSSGTLPDGRVYFTMEYVPGSDLEMIWKELSQAAGQGGTTSASMLSDSSWTEAVQSASRKSSGQKANATKIASEATAIAGLSINSASDDPGGYIRRVVSLARDVARALQAIHDQGVIHRDVKPANLMLTADGSRVVLMDFGLAKSQTNSIAVSRDGGLLGTLRYAAPEQLAAANIKVGPAADVRGLGVTMWELLTRQRLFGHAEDEASLTQDVLTADVPRLRSIDHKFDRDLDAIVARATERRLSDRIQSAGLLADYLQLWLEGKPLPIRPLTVTELSVRWVREHAVAAITSAVMIMLLLTIGFVVLRANLINRQRSQQAMRELVQQTDAILNVATPAIAEDIQSIDVEIKSDLTRIQALREQSKSIQTTIDSGLLIGEDLSQAKSAVQSVVENVSTISKYVDAVNHLVAARTLRFIVTENSFQLANGRATVFGRDGIDIYSRVFSSLLGSDIFSDEMSLDAMADKLRSQSITQHLRMALDDWFILCFLEAEIPTRKRLASIAERLDEGSEKPVRQAIRAAIINEDAASLIKLADDWRKGDFSADKLSSGLLLADGLLENLKLGHSIDLFRLIKFHGANIHPPAPRYIRLWANNLLGVLLSKVGSRAEIHEAMESFEAAHALEPDLDVIRLNLAQCELNLLRPAEALKRLEAVSDPRMVLFKHALRANAHGMAGQAVEARKIAAQLMVDNPNSLSAHSLAAMIYANVFDHDAARQTALAGLKIDPQTLDLIATGYHPTDPAYADAMSKVPEFDLRHWWQGKVTIANNLLNASLASHDYKSVNEARATLQQLGIRDWQLSDFEYRALFIGEDFNALSWEPTLRKLHSEAPPICAERYPSTTLGSLIDLRGSLGSEDIQQLLLREAISFPVVSPIARFEKLDASARLLNYVQPKAAYRFHEAALNLIPELKDIGYGTEESWQLYAEQTSEAIAQIREPDSIDASTEEGKLRRAGAYHRYGTAEYFAGNTAAARSYFEEGLVLAHELVEANSESKLNCNALVDALLDMHKVVLDSKDISVSRQLVKLAVSFAEEISKESDNAVDLNKLAEAYRAAGITEERDAKLPEAKEWFDKSIATYEQLAQEVEHRPAGSEAVYAFDATFDLANAYVTAGSLSIDLKDFDNARALYLKSLSLAEPRAKASPNNFSLQNFVAVIQSGLGRAALKQGKLDEAIERFQQAVTLTEARLALRQESASELDTAAQLYNLLSLVYQNKDEWENALIWAEKEVNAARKRLQFAPLDTNFRRRLAEALDGRASIKLMMKRLDEALKDWNEAIALSPDKANYLIQRAHVHNAQDQWQETIEDITQAHKLDAELPPIAWRMRAESFVNLQHWPEASDDYAQLFTLTTPDATTHVSAGIAHILAGKLDDGRTVLEEALKLDPNQLSAHRYLANIFAAQEKWTPSLEHFRLAMANDISFPSSWSGANSVAIALKDEDQANAICQQAAARLLNAPDAEQADTVVWLCSRYPSNDAMDEILKKLSDAWPSNAPSDALKPVTRAALYYRLDKWDQCVDVLEAWLTTDQRDSDENAWLILAMARIHQKRTAEAQSALEHAKQVQRSQSENASYMAPIRWSPRFETKLLREEAERLMSDAAK